MIKTIPLKPTKCNCLLARSKNFPIGFSTPSNIRKRNIRIEIDSNLNYLPLKYLTFEKQVVRKVHDNVDTVPGIFRGLRRGL